MTMNTSLSSLTNRARLSLRLVPTLFLLAAAACGGGGDSATNPGNPGNSGNPVVTTSVNIQGTAFNPNEIQVSPGATVSFTNNDGFAHNVTFSSSAITSITDFSTGTKSTAMPTVAGTYAFHCTIHPSMTGTVKVQ
jgi:plastocyanin